MPPGEYSYLGGIYIYIYQLNSNQKSYLAGVLLGGLLPFQCYPLVIATPLLLFLPLSTIITDTPLWLTLQVKLLTNAQ